MAIAVPWTVCLLSEVSSEKSMLSIANLPFTISGGRYLSPFNDGFLDFRFYSQQTIVLNSHSEAVEKI